MGSHHHHHHSAALEVLFQGPGVQDLQEKMQEVNAEKLQHENEKLESSHELGSIRTLKAQKLIDLDNIKRELSYYNDATKRKLDFMSSAPGWEDAYQTYQLLKEYESAFEAPAYGPIYMNLKCKEKGFAALIEGFFRTDTFRTFIMSNYNDYLKLMDLITSKTKYTPTIREFSSERKKKIEDFEPPCSREKLQSFGFDGYVIDFLEGPEVVLVALCHMLKIHQIPIAKRELPPASVNALNNFRLANGDPVLKTYLAGSSIHLVFRSAYGDREITRRTDPLPSRSIYFSENVEMDLVKRKEEQLNAQLSQLENLQNEERKLQEKVNEHESLLSRTNDILSTLRKERDEK
uniref:Structural maintenance of chromosomes protein 5 n=1 Tax=Schizosaccharomyces pombe TaxID=4896 RepID=UPI00097BA53E|nr:Chain A, Structural maintenance of chromosomes protein 5 [Schizosaccharomyces pombe]5MG8_C Chain C, Structural maintenance of chromosomes protein 5 [Schizosaccharomyces pombe]